MAKLMGIVNVTPDSFSDGGLYLDAERAIEHARGLLAEGADLLDVAGESTRPGAQAVSAEEELERIGPVLEGLRGVGAPISIDTSKAAVAEPALDAGARIVNDVTALRSDPELAALCGQRGCGVVLMHMKGTPRTMQEEPVIRGRGRRGEGTSSRNASSSRSRRGSPRSGSGWIRGSASARPFSTTSSSFAGSASCMRSAGRSSSGPPARASSAGSRVAGWTTGSAARSPPTCSPSGPARTCFGSTT